jgi:hypothetical protein
MKAIQGTHSEFLISYLQPTDVFAAHILKYAFFVDGRNG